MRAPASSWLAPDRRCGIPAHLAPDVALRGHALDLLRPGRLPPWCPACSCRIRLDGPVPAAAGRCRPPPGSVVPHAAATLPARRLRAPAPGPVARRARFPGPAGDVTLARVKARLAANACSALLGLALTGGLVLPIAGYVAGKRVIGAYEGKLGLSDYLDSIYAAAGRRRVPGLVAAAVAGPDRHRLVPRHPPGWQRLEADAD